MKGPLTLLLVLVSGASSAQTPTQYTLADLERLALESHPALQMAAAATAGGHGQRRAGRRVDESRRSVTRATKYGPAGSFGAGSTVSSSSR